MRPHDEGPYWVVLGTFLSGLILLSVIRNESISALLNNRSNARSSILVDDDGTFYSTSAKNGWQNAFQTGAHREHHKSETSHEAEQPFSSHPDSKKINAQPHQSHTASSSSAMLHGVSPSDHSLGRVSSDSGPDLPKVNFSSYPKRNGTGLKRERRIKAGLKIIKLLIKFGQPLIWGTCIVTVLTFFLLAAHIVGHIVSHLSRQEKSIPNHPPLMQMMHSTGFQGVAFPPAPSVTPAISVVTPLQQHSPATSAVSPLQQHSPATSAVSPLQQQPENCSPNAANLEETVTFSALQAAGSSFNDTWVKSTAHDDNLVVSERAADMMPDRLDLEVERKEFSVKQERGAQPEKTGKDPDIKREDILSEEDKNERAEKSVKQAERRGSEQAKREVYQENSEQVAKQVERERWENSDQPARHMEKEKAEQDANQAELERSKEMDQQAEIERIEIAAKQAERDELTMTPKLSERDTGISAFHMEPATVSIREAVAARAAALDHGIAQVLLECSLRFGKIPLPGSHPTEEASNISQASKVSACATSFQALWRGYLVRRSSTRRMADIRQRLIAATQISQKEPHRRIGVQLREAISILMIERDPIIALQPLLRAQRYTQVSGDCCMVMTRDPGIVAELIQHMDRCDQSSLHRPTLIAVLGVISNICCHQDLLPAVFHAQDSIVVLTEKLNQFKDCADIFMAVISILQRLLASKEIALAMARRSELLWRWESIAKELSIEMQSELQQLQGHEEERRAASSGISGAQSRRWSMSTNDVFVLTASKSLEALLAVAVQATKQEPPEISSSKSEVDTSSSHESPLRSDCPSPVQAFESQDADADTTSLPRESPSAGVNSATLQAGLVSATFEASGVIQMDLVIHMDPVIQMDLVPSVPTVPTVPTLMPTNYELDSCCSTIDLLEDPFGEHSSLPKLHTGHSALQQSQRDESGTTSSITSAKALCNDDVQGAGGQVANGTGSKNALVMLQLSEEVEDDDVPPQVLFPLADEDTKTTLLPTCLVPYASEGPQTHYPPLQALQGNVVEATIKGTSEQQYSPLENSTMSMYHHTSGPVAITSSLVTAIPTEQTSIEDPQPQPQPDQEPLSNSVNAHGHGEQTFQLPNAFPTATEVDHAKVAKAEESKAATPKVVSPSAVVTPKHTTSTSPGSCVSSPSRAASAGTSLSARAPSSSPASGASLTTRAASVRPTPSLILSTRATSSSPTSVSRAAASPKAASANVISTRAASSSPRGPSSRLAGGPTASSLARKVPQTLDEGKSPGEGKLSGDGGLSGGIKVSPKAKGKTSGWKI